MSDHTAFTEQQVDILNAECVRLRARIEQLEQQLTRAAIAERMYGPCSTSP